MKRIHIKTVLLSILIIIAAILLLFTCLLWPVICSAVSVKQLEDDVYSEESHQRYEILTETLRSPMSMDEVRDAMDSVSKHNFDSVFVSTEWSIVFDQSGGEAKYYHRENYGKAYSFRVGQEAWFLSGACFYRTHFQARSKQILKFL